MRPYNTVILTPCLSIAVDPELLREAGVRLPPEPDERVADAGERGHGAGQQQQLLHAHALRHGVRPLRRGPRGRHPGPGAAAGIHPPV